MTGWRKTATGWVRGDGKWRVRGPIMGKPMYWIYRVGAGRLRRGAAFDTAVSFPTATAARNYVDHHDP